MKKIPQFEPWLGEEEKRLLCECIDDNWITGGLKVKEFERRIAELCQVKHAIACCNGTLGLYMVLAAMGIGEKIMGAGVWHEVIVPDFTFIASANAVMMVGAVPVFVDINKADLNINIKNLEKAITPMTKAIMPVHIYGRPAAMDDVMALAAKYKLKVIEDAAQGVGVSYKGKPVGGIGDAGMISFYGDKTITTGEGGMVLTNDDELAYRCLLLKHQGRTGRGIYYHEHIGYNFRLTDLQAAVGLAQLGKLAEIIIAKKTSEALYKKLLCNTPGVKFLKDRNNTKTVPFRIVAFVDNPDGLGEYLKKYGIGTNRVFRPLHMQPCYKQWKWKAYENPSWNFPNSIWAYEHGLALPSSAKLTTEQIEYICQAIDVFQRHNHMANGAKVE